MTTKIIGILCIACTIIVAAQLAAKAYDWIRGVEYVCHMEVRK